jgi:hypothetical protein
MPKVGRSIVSRLVCRFRGRAVVELENLALRHQLHVLRRQRPGWLRLFTCGRLLWVWLDPAIRSRLRDLLLPEIESLEHLIERDLSNWKNATSRPVEPERFEHFQAD